MFRFVFTGKAAAYSAAITGGSFVFLSHSVFLDDKKKIFQLYRNYEEVPFRPKHQELVQEVLNDLKVKDPSRYSFFYCFGQNTMNAGWLPLGKVIIGIPFNFHYESVLDINPSSISLPGGKPFDWNSEDGEKFLKTLVLSREAQKFAIAREIYYNDTLQVPVNAILAGAFFKLSYNLSSYFKSKLPWKKFSYLSKFLVYGICAALVGSIVICIKDTANFAWEQQADIKAGKLSPEYFKGGLEFYGKMRDRHIALHNLKLDHIYTSNGNLKTFIRTKVLPVSTHLDILRDLAPMYLEKEE